MFETAVSLPSQSDAADAAATAAVAPAAAATAGSAVAATAVAPSGGFAALGLAAPLVTALRRLDIVDPTPVQAEAIPLLLSGRDLIASAPTGTGKTAAFLLPALQRIVDARAKRVAPAVPSGRRGRPTFGPRVLVLTPTRELAQQVARHGQALSRSLPRVTTVCVTGGESYYLQNRLLASPYEILVATPGRLLDQLQGGRIDLSRVAMLVLDEADRMLDMGFADDVVAIGEAVPAARQTVCFTATLSRAVRTLADRLLRDPAWMEVARVASDAAPIDDHVVYVDNPHHRGQILRSCLTDDGMGQAIVFTATKRHAEQLAGELFQSGIAAVALHGDLGQRDRTRALNRLRRGECKVLVATDVAARGLDVSTITHVINYDLPKVAEDYVHRIGRTGRAGASGQAVSLVGREDVIALRRIEHFIGRRVQVSAIEGLEAAFRPAERRPRKPGEGFRKPRFGNGAGPRRDGRKASPGKRR